MITTLAPEQNFLERFRSLTPEEQQEVITFIEFLHFKANYSEINEIKEPISAYEAGKEWIGCVDSGIGDLSYNKKYLQSPVKS